MTTHTSRFTRRQILSRGAAVLGSLAFGGAFGPLFAVPENRRFKIGTVDWSIGKIAKPEAMQVAKALGFDGIQISLGTLADNMHLRKSEVQQQYKEATKQTGIEISSLGIGELNNIPYKSDPRTIEWVSDSVDVMQALSVKVTLLAFFMKGNLKGDKAGIDEVVRRLKVVVPKAEKAGVVFGIESYLSADEHLDIIQRVGSPAIKVYYDVSNSIRQGYDIYKEIRQLGRMNICEFHAKEKGTLLGRGLVDYQKVRAAIDDIGYTGWIQIEDAVAKGSTFQKCYPENLRYLRSVFSA